MCSSTLRAGGHVERSRLFDKPFPSSGDNSDILASKSTVTKSPDSVDSVWVPLAVLGDHTSARSLLYKPLVGLTQ